MMSAEVFNFVLMERYFSLSNIYVHILFNFFNRTLDLFWFNPEIDRFVLKGFEAWKVFRIEFLSS